MKRIIIPHVEDVPPISIDTAMHAHLYDGKFIAYRIETHSVVLYKFDNRYPNKDSWGFLYLTSPHSGGKYCGNSARESVEKALKGGVHLMLCDSLKECLEIPYLK